MSNSIQKTTHTIQAVGKYIYTSPNKVRRILNQIRGKSYREALLILEFLPYRSCKPIKEVLKSARANAIHNHKLEKSSLVIGETFANAGPKLKRLRPRAKGRAFNIYKPTCHISISIISNN